MKSLDDFFEKQVSLCAIPGASMYVERRGDVLHNAVYGTSRPDSIYKIFSMSKAVTAVACLICMERGLFNPLENAARYIPALKTPLVVGAGGAVRKARNPVTIKTLLNMTSGIVYPGADHPADIAMQSAREEMRAVLTSGGTLTNRDVANRLCAVPLQFEPGTNFRYGASADIMGAIIEVVTGTRFGEFLRREIFGPLGMADTDFYVPPEKLPRLVPMYTRNEKTGECGVLSDTDRAYLEMDKCGIYPVFESGGGGLFSTMADYTAFARVLLRDGAYTAPADGSERRLYGRKTAALLHENSLEGTARDSFHELRPGHGYNCYMRILEEPGIFGSTGSVGEFGWDGLPGHYFLIDQAEDLLVVYMQHIAQGADLDMRQKYCQLIYAAVE